MNLKLLYLLNICTNELTVAIPSEYLYKQPSRLSINTFKQQCAVLKGMLQSPRLKDHVNTIAINQ